MGKSGRLGLSRRALPSKWNAKKGSCISKAIAKKTIVKLKHRKSPTTRQVEMSDAMSDVEPQQQQLEQEPEARADGRFVFSRPSSKRTSIKKR
mmetsp:Transcript_17135/g.22243  ORF Transcript_17135/g.22243 Transcript_17135/m.22243 type:complete len:93 (-) Transcript_17135:247-525(-)